VRIADSNSRKAVNISSACTMKRFPLRCASTIQIVQLARQHRIAPELFLIDG
jgi:hypothetical protein